MKDKYNNFSISFESEGEANECFEHISKSFPDLDRQTFDYISDLILEIDKSILGRFAANVSDLMAFASSRYVTSKKFRASDAKHLAHVEIGTLFGASALLTDRMIKSNETSDKFRNIMIDPLKGYYGTSADVVTGLEVTDELLFKNLEKFDAKNYEVLQGYSLDAAVLNRINELTVVSLFIDGDHTFAGILKDWNNYSGNVIVGGHVIIDNVNDKTWPNIELFMQELKSKIGEAWEIIYEGGVTTILEKKLDAPVLIKTIFDLDTIHEIERRDESKTFETLSNALERVKTRENEIENLRRTLDKAHERILTRDNELNKLNEMLSKAYERIQTRDNELNSLKEKLSKAH